MNTAEIAKWEILWWRAHHDKDMEKLKSGLSTWNRELFGISEESAADEIAMQWLTAAKAHDERDLDKSLVPLTKAYSMLKDVTSFDFNPDLVAKYEVSWWGVHDRLEFEPDKSELAQCFADLFAALFSLDPGKLKSFGEYKANATYEHDLAEDSKTDQSKVEFHWKRAEIMLNRAYLELKALI